VAELDAVFLIIHPCHLKRGTDPQTADLTSIGRDPHVTHILDGIAVEYPGGVNILKSRGGLSYPDPFNELTAELSARGKLTIIRGEPNTMAQATLSAILTDWQVTEPLTYMDNCSRCGTWVEHHSGLTGRHFAPCGLLCEAVVPPNPKTHSPWNCPTCGGGVKDPYIAIREIFPDGSAYDRWGEFAAKLPKAGIDELLEWRPHIKVWV